MKPFRFSFPSLRTLLLASFALVLLPLALALISALYSLEKLTDYSQVAVYHAVRSTQGSRMLLERLTAMERSAKQFLVLDDPELWQSYLRGHEEFSREIQGLFDVVNDEALRKLLDKLSAYEFDLYTMMLAEDMTKEAKLAEADQFKYLRTLASDIWQRSINLVGTGLHELEDRSKLARQQTLKHLAILLPIALLLLMFFIYLIIRPIRQIDLGIRKLGDRDFDEAIVVQGPRDLKYLGKRLDWLRTRLRMLEAEKQRFLRNVSHELKTPLANIHEGTELLGDQVVGNLNEEQKEIIHILSDSATKLHKLIEDLIHYSQVQNTDEKLKARFIDMRSLIEEVIEDYRVRLRANQIEIQAKLETLEIYGFPDKMRTVIDNLISNAVKYSPRHSVIEISLYRSNQEMLLDIRDYGPGIPPEERKRVFDALYQGSAGRQMGIPGTGLGLAIVSECIAMHHGQVEILDPPTAKSGAFFRISLPLDMRR